MDEQEDSHLDEEEAQERTDEFVETVEDDLDKVLLNLRANNIPLSEREPDSLVDDKITCCFRS